MAESERPLRSYPTDVRRPLVAKTSSMDQRLRTELRCVGASIGREPASKSSKHRSPLLPGGHRSGSAAGSCRRARAATSPPRRAPCLDLGAVGGGDAADADQVGARLLQRVVVSRKSDAGDEVLGQGAVLDLCRLVQADAVTVDAAVRPAVDHQREGVIGNAAVGVHAAAVGPPNRRTRTANRSSSPGRRRSPGSSCCRMAPVAGRSSPICQRAASVSVPAPFVWSTVSPKMSEKDSFRAPDCM